MGRKSNNWLLIAPMYIFTLLFVAGPLIYMLVLSFLQKADVWGVEFVFTLKNYLKIGKQVYLNTFWESIKLAFATTALTLLIGYPFGYFMAKLPEKRKTLFMLLIVIPFWTNALMRMYGWIILFRSNGLIEQGLIDTTPLITHRFALENIEEGYHIFENRLDGVIKIAVEP